MLKFSRSQSEELVTPQQWRLDCRASQAGPGANLSSILSSSRGPVPCNTFRELYTAAQYLIYPNR